MYFCVKYIRMPKRQINTSIIHILIVLLPLIILFYGCSSTKHLKEDELLLNKVKITSTNGLIKSSEYRSYIRQEANSRWFNLSKVPLSIYNISGKDSTKAINRMFRRIGEAPVVYNHEMTEYSEQTLVSAMNSRGYLHAKVSTDTIIKKKKVNLTYILNPGKRSYIKQVQFLFDDENIKAAVLQDTTSSLLRIGAPLKVSTLQAERNRIIEKLRNKGYYKLNKEYISFQADTLYNGKRAYISHCYSTVLPT